MVLLYCFSRGFLRNVVSLPEQLRVLLLQRLQLRVLLLLHSAAVRAAEHYKSGSALLFLTVVRLLRVEHSTITASRGGFLRVFLRRGVFVVAPILEHV